MLEDLLTGREKSSQLLIKDNAHTATRHLLLNWIEHLLNRCDHVILVCSERPPDFFSNWLQPDVRERLLCVYVNAALPDADRASSLLSAIRDRLTAGQDVQCGVVLDSLSPFLWSDGLTTTCSLLHALGQEETVSQVVSVLHANTQDTQSCALIEHTCASVLALRPVTPHMDTWVCAVRHCRTTGKVFRTEESFTFNESFRISNVCPYTVEKKSYVDDSMEQTPTDLGVTFNLSLTDKEKEDRSQVKLPYIKDGGDDSQPSSRIHYQPDAADDFDEEDPDDDLNI